MIRTAMILLGAATLLSACSPAPCASCLLVSGNYRETVMSASTGCGDPQTLTFGGGQGVASVSQTGSELGLTGDVSMSGVLHADGSATFGPSPAQAMPVDGSGNPDPSGTPVSGKVYLSGFFGTTSGRVSSFEGTYYFVADNDGCEVDARVTWSH